MQNEPTRWAIPVRKKPNYLSIKVETNSGFCWFCFNNAFQHLKDEYKVKMLIIIKTMMTVILECG